jgi:hypothetical protein
MNFATLVTLAVLLAASPVDPPTAAGRQVAPEAAVNPATPRPAACASAPATGADPGAGSHEAPAPRFCALKPHVKPSANAVPDPQPVQGATR